MSADAGAIVIWKVDESILRGANSTWKSFWSNKIIIFCAYLWRKVTKRFDNKWQHNVTMLFVFKWNYSVLFRRFTKIVWKIESIIFHKNGPGYISWIDIAFQEFKICHIIWWRRMDIEKRNAEASNISKIKSYFYKYIIKL